MLTFFPSILTGSLTLPFHPGLSVSLLKEYCDSVFQHGHDASAIRRVYVYGVLWHLCLECSGLESDPRFSERCQGLERIFASQIEQAVNELRLVIPATAEAASALTTAVGVTDVRSIGRDIFESQTIWERV